jgi:gluconate 2-dehydrogenase gamma chain
MKPDRRLFLKSLTALTAAGRLPVVAEGAGLEGAAEASLPAAPAAQPAAFSFFTGPEVEFVEAALARLIPADELGPGAREAGVAAFIDRQLAGGFGRLERGYTLGPHQDGTPEQGLQFRLLPAEAYRAAIAETDRVCLERFGGPFAALGPAEQDEVLRGLDEGRIALPSVSATEFFSLLWQNTQEGFFADPLYGGNRDKAGWKLVGFPGVAAVYTAEIGRHGPAYRAAPVSIADLQQGRAAVDGHGHPVHQRLRDED